MSIKVLGVDATFVEKAIETNRPFTIKTATGDAYLVPHRDFISFSARKTTVILSFEKEGAEEVAYIPLLTITSVETAPTTSEGVRS